jgi:hypothetical protein
VLYEILEEPVASSRGRKNPRAVKRKMSNYPVKSRQLRTSQGKLPVKIILLSEQYWG